MCKQCDFEFCSGTMVHRSAVLFSVFESFESLKLLSCNFNLMIVLLNPMCPNLGGQASALLSPALPDQTAEVAAPFTFQVPKATAGGFSGASLADGSALPSWLQFDAQQGLFTGTPNSASELSIELKGQGDSEGKSSNFLLKAGGLGAVCRYWSGCVPGVTELLP